MRKKRHTAAHVADLEFTEEDVDNYLFEMLRVVEKLQECHADDYLKNFDVDDYQKIAEMIASPQDQKVFIENLINNLSQAHTFSAAESYETRILQLRTYLSGEQIRKILNVVFDNPYTINQVLEANGTLIFFKQLYDLGRVDKKNWIIFARRLIEYFGDRESELVFYNWLFSKFGLPTYIIKRKVDLSDIPL